MTTQPATSEGSGYTRLYSAGLLLTRLQQSPLTQHPDDQQAIAEALNVVTIVFRLSELSTVYAASDDPVGERIKLEHQLRLLTGIDLAAPVHVGDLPPEPHISRTPNLDQYRYTQAAHTGDPLLTRVADLLEAGAGAWTQEGGRDASS